MGIHFPLAGWPAGRGAHIRQDVKAGEPRQSLLDCLAAGTHEVSFGAMMACGALVVWPLRQLVPSCLFDLKRAEIMTDGYDGFILNDSHVDRIKLGSIDESYFLSAGDSLAIGNESFYRLAPDDDELLFYDILYAGSGALVGFELRVHCDSVRKRFIDETASLEYVEGDGWPRVWVGRTTSGVPKSSTTELFCDLHLCRTPDARWAILIKSDLLASSG